MRHGAGEKEQDDAARTGAKAETLKVTASEPADDSLWLAAYRRHEELKRQFLATHEAAKICLATRDYNGLAEAIERESIIIQEHTRLVDRYLASTKPPEETG